MKLAFYLKHYLLTDIAVLVIAGCLIGASGVVFAKEGTTDLTRRDRVLNHFDKNDDGTLGDREKAYARHQYNQVDRNDDDQLSKRERVYNRVDKNNDGAIGDREKAYAKRTHNRVDRNDDGQISKRERKVTRHVKHRKQNSRSN